tara:strand:- start:1371 stop:1637 length:267 start_codon:yes stop_codon:yes gene_type:complete
MSDTTSAPLRIIPLRFTLSTFLLITFVICVAFGMLAPQQFHMHEAWAPLLPSFEWLTPTEFLFGAIGAFAYGWFIAIVFVPLHRFFHK